MGRTTSLAWMGSVFAAALWALSLGNGCGSEVAVFPADGGGGSGASSGTGGGGGSGAIGGSTTSGTGGGGAIGAGGSGGGGTGGTTTGGKLDGEPCANAGECQSGNCPAADGVCCDSACDGECEACLGSKTGAGDGTCAAVSADSDPDGECAPAQCTGGAETAASLCNGQGACNTPPGLVCDPYTCDSAGVACLSACSSGSDCIAGHFCDPNGVCAPLEPNGSPCVDGGECASGFCVDDVCCDGACSASCEVCSVAAGGADDGTCGPAPFGDGGDPACPGNQVCDGVGTTCVAPCAASQINKRSVGCEYHPVYMDAFAGLNVQCFAAFVVNNWISNAQISVSYQGAPLPVASFARIPSGAGPTLTYQPYDAVNGLPPDEVAILFLSGPNCPVASAVPGGVQLVDQTGIGDAFHVTSNVPIAAYQINPYGGGASATTGASLLLPIDAWGDNYMLQTAADSDITLDPSLNVVAAEDNTTITMRTVADVVGGGGVPAANQGNVFTFTLDAGEHAQLTQADQLAGSILQADKPVGVMSGHRCMRAPIGVGFCDHAEQMLPPVNALGHEYVAVMHRPRSDEPGIWRVVGVVDGTDLTYSSNVGGPSTVNEGDSVDFVTPDPFVVSSQGATHPFMVFNIMSGSTWPQLTDTTGYGDPDYVINVPPEQYLRGEYQFFTDPTYPETNLVVVRSMLGGQFYDVNIDCAGTLSGWQAVGAYEWTRVDLITGDFQDVGSCSTGRRTVDSVGPFGLWVWGWGSPETSTFTRSVSYGYPAAAIVADINAVQLVP